MILCVHNNKQPSSLPTTTPRMTDRGSANDSYQHHCLTTTTISSPDDNNQQPPKLPHHHITTPTWLIPYLPALLSILLHLINQSQSCSGLHLIPVSISFQSPSCSHIPPQLVFSVGLVGVFNAVGSLSVGTLQSSTELVLTSGQHGKSDHHPW